MSISRVLNIIAGSALTFMMFLTFADVILRAGGVPIIGTYEIVSLLLAIVIAFGLPQVSIDKGHVYMEFLIEVLPELGKKLMNTFTRILCFVLFLLAGINLLNVAKGYRIAKEVTATIKIPFYPIAYLVALCCFIECIVFIFEIVRIWEKKHE